MSGTSRDPGRAPTAREWTQRLSIYRRPSTGRGVLELAITAVPFVAAWIAMVLAIHFSQYWLFALLLLPTAGLVVRLFMIQHDCGHGAFFPARAANDWTGRVIGLITMTPYDYWRRTHAVHHATSGNLDSRGVGDVDTLTASEYLARSPWGRFRYRLYRHPVVMFLVGPIYVFGIQYRIPLGLMNKRLPWLSTMGTNVAIAAVALFLMWMIGIVPFFLVHVPVVLLAAAAGVWLFYVQHQFEDTRWAGADSWNILETALHGSSYYDLPGPLRWFTGNIGMHHVHHLSSRIPFYRLPSVLKDHPELRSISRLTIRQSLGCIRLVLWDEVRQRLVSFDDVKTEASPPSPEPAVDLSPDSAPFHASGEIFRECVLERPGKVQHTSILATGADDL